MIYFILFLACSLFLTSSLCFFHILFSFLLSWHANNYNQESIRNAIIKQTKFGNLGNTQIKSSLVCSSTLLPFFTVLKQCILGILVFIFLLIHLSTFYFLEFLYLPQLCLFSLFCRLKFGKQYVSSADGWRKCKLSIKSCKGMAPSVYQRKWEGGVGRKNKERDK